MCCCGKPTVNGQLDAYSWDGKSFSTRPVDPPDLANNDVLLLDLPGRCGGVDGHSHHFRLVMAGRLGQYDLLVRHATGNERHPLGRGVVGALMVQKGTFDKLTEDQAYWLCYTLFLTAREAANKASADESAKWRRAAAEKRIKTKKRRYSGVTDVWIVEPKQPTPTN